MLLREVRDLVLLLCRHAAPVTLAPVGLVIGHGFSFRLFTRRRIDQLVILAAGPKLSIATPAAVGRLSRLRIF